MAKRTTFLLCALSIALASLGLVHRKGLDGWFSARASLAPMHCDQAAPDWLKQVAAWGQRHEIPGLQIYFRDGPHTYACTSGIAIDAAGNRRKMDSSMPMPFASLTKIFTSALTLLLDGQGTVVIDRSLRESLDGSRYSLPDSPAWQSMTLRQLLMHRAGFDRALSGDPLFWPISPCPFHPDLLEKVTIDFPPGTRYAYSNLGYCLVGVALRHHSGKSDQELLNLVLDAAGPTALASIHYTTLEDLRQSDSFPQFATTGEMRDFNQFHWNEHAWTGALAGTAVDLGEFLHRMEPSADSSLGQIGRQLLTPLPDCDDTRWRTCHGLVFYSYRQPGHGRMYWRDGSLPGATAFAAVAETGKVFVLLANSRKPAWMPAHDELGKLVYEHVR